MADFVATAGFDAVELIETTDLILGRNAATESIPVGSGKPANKQAQKLLNNIQALKTGAPRSLAVNAMLSGPVDGSDLPNWGTWAGRILTIDGTVTPLLFSFANGLTDFGSSDVVVKYSSSTTLDFTALTGTFTIFAVWDGSAISFVKLPMDLALVTYHAQHAAPSLGGDQFWYDPKTRKMFREVTGAFAAVNAIFIAGVTLSGPAGSYLPKPYGIPAFNMDAPAGTVQVWTTAINPPQGWLICDGTGVRMANYPELYNCIGSTYGISGTLFNLPDFTGTTINSVSVQYIIKAY